VRHRAQAHVERGNVVGIEPVLAHEGRHAVERGMDARHARMGLVTHLERLPRFTEACGKPCRGGRVRMRAEITAVWRLEHVKYAGESRARELRCIDAALRSAAA